MSVSALPDQDAVQPEILLNIAGGLAASVTGREKLERRGGRRYVRLLATAAYDAWLIEWYPGSDLDLHDHGGSSGAFHVVEGVLLEQYIDLDRPGSFETLETLAFGPGHTREMAPLRVHRVWNPGPLQAVTVHVYSPPLSSMNYFSLEEGGSVQLLHTRPVDAGSLEPSGA
ncbi:MAG TPA: cysteine dioxygenase family protein [Actinomycetota bacterium]|nr:cysteine dioxygenase family protein [Actinomycetota bacterium]